MARKKNISIVDVDEEQEQDYNIMRCITCKKEIEDVPWITVDCGVDDQPVQACGYSCSTRLKYYVGVGYWPRVINKEDFPGPRPIINAKVIGDITANFGIDEIRREIEDEEERMELMEEYESDDSSYYGGLSP